MCSCSSLSRSSLVLMAPFFLLTQADADELLPPPIPVLRIGGSDTELESVPARRVELAAEMITEKYPNRKVKIEREVVQDDERNYVNHGPWKMWDPEGRLVAHGEFRFGKQHGDWVRLMSNFGVVDDAFQPPFTSKAEFANGQLHGTWTISDNRQRLVGSWEFDHGELHGKATRWYANGQPQEEVMFRRGKLDGESNSFSAKGALANREFFRDGKQLIPVVTWHEPNQQKQAEGWLQTNEVTVHQTVDWWRGLLTISRETPVDEPIRIGKWTEWYPNGNTRFTGTFRDGESVGTHTWWHENGQKQLIGRYAEGQRVDRWTRWHANGRKQEEGEFFVGSKRGVWKVWAEDGQLIDEQKLALVPDTTENQLVPARPISIKP
ncbi:MAG TPA: hypothetical protein QF564_26170 [Pirellulaceae bacterium]|nr:hypothetical protein [Pirellulaceae bacterium]